MLVVGFTLRFMKALLTYHCKQSAFGSKFHEIHRIRRSALNRYFSKASITKLEPRIYDLANQLRNKLLDRRGNGKPFEVTSAYSCFTTDVISYYAFGESEGFLKRENFELNLRAALHSSARPAPFIRQWPFLLYLIDSVSEYVFLILNWR